MNSLFARSTLILSATALVAFGGTANETASHEGITVETRVATSIAANSSALDALSDTLSLADGAFTSEQSSRGKDEFGRSCSECHDLVEVRGADFMFNWEGSSVGRLYRTISRTMPEDDPGSLGTEVYLAVVAYILELNDFPAGEATLTADTERLNALVIER